MIASPPMMSQSTRCTIHIIVIWGITIRKPLDCMIAAVAIEHGVALLHCDRDFDPMSRHCGLAVVGPEWEGQQGSVPGDR